MQEAGLKWACRRGMLELDLILQAFLNESYPGLSTDEKVIFKDLLTVSDPELFAWIMGSEIPTNKAFLTIITLIRTHARHRNLRT